MIKLIVSDLDGTLLTTQKTISKTNYDTIQIAKERGIEFMIATGREYTSVKELMEKYNLPAEAILMNGAIHRDIHGNITEMRAIEDNKVRAIIDILDRYQAACVVCLPNDTYGLTSDFDFKERLIRRFQNIKPPIKNKIIEEILSEAFWANVTLIPTVDALFALNQPILKLEVFDFQDGTFSKVKEELEALKLSIIPYGQHNMEITAFTAEKGAMLEDIIRHKQLTKEEVMVIGDGYNDVSMFTRFPNSVAMMNAHDDIKAHASFVTTLNDEDGVSYAIHQLALTK